MKIRQQIEKEQVEKRAQAETNFKKRMEEKRRLQLDSIKREIAEKELTIKEDEERKK